MRETHKIERVFMHFASPLGPAPSVWEYGGPCIESYRSLVVTLQNSAAVILS